MSIVEHAMSRPYTVGSMIILLSILGLGSALRMPIDIFPEIDIPVVSVVWTYNGMSPIDIQNRILTLHERQLASLVDDISRIESTSYEGVGVEKVFLHEGADVTRAISQLSSSALVVLKYMPPNITPPLVLRYGATDVPIIQLSLSSKLLPDTKLNDLGQNIIRPSLAVVHGAEVPYPYGGKPRVIMADLNLNALTARGLSVADVSSALQRQNVILPSGDVKIGSFDYNLLMNNSPDVVDSINSFPIKYVDGHLVYMSDVAHVHDGFQVQTNSVSVNGTQGALMTIRKTGGVSTLSVIDGVKKSISDLKGIIPKEVEIKSLFDQSIFVKAALRSVLLSAGMAAILTAIVIILFLGNIRLSSIIMASIPLSIVSAVLFLKATGQTLNTMTLGGFALAIGILVDNSTVVIENIERHIRNGESLKESIINGSHEVAVPTSLSTLCICIVFIPVFLLEGTAKYLFSPLSISVIGSLISSLILSFTMVPVLFGLLMARKSHVNVDENNANKSSYKVNYLMYVQQKFENMFNLFREKYRNILSFLMSRSKSTAVIFIVFFVLSSFIFPFLGRDFFPPVDAGQIRLHVRAPAGTRLESTKIYFSEVENKIGEIIGASQIETILDNIGLPYSGINIALSDSATVGPMDGEILISLKKKHVPSGNLISKLRSQLPKEFAELEFFFQPANIVDQVLNFGQPSPIDVRISGPNTDDDYLTALHINQGLRSIPGIVDAHIFQVPSAPTISINMDRQIASQSGVTQQDAASNLLVATNSSAQTTPNFWVDPRNSVSYPLVIQVPTYRINDVQDIENLPVESREGDRRGQLLSNLSTFGHETSPLVMSQLNIRPVFDVDADVQGIDLYSASKSIDMVINKEKMKTENGITINLSGQVETMRESYIGLFTGIGLAIVLVYLFLVMNFQSWLDPLIVLMAIPFALVGILWMLYLSFTPMSVPALMGSLMCIGLTTANSILVISFANQRLAAGDSPMVSALTAGYTRLRPVLMTASAMVFGMVPMALGIGEGGEQNAPLGRAVIGGLLFATIATLIFVPIMFQLLRNRPKSISHESRDMTHAN